MLMEGDVVAQSGRARKPNSPPYLTAAGESGRHAWRLFAVFILLSMVIGTIGWWGYCAEADHLRNKANQELKAIADFKAAQIEDWLSERRQDAKALVASTTFRNDFEHWLKRGDAAIGERLAARLDSLRINKYYTGIELLDPQGVSRLMFGGVRRDTVELSPQWLSAISRESEPQLIDLHRDANGLSLAYVVPVRHGSADEPIGYVRFAIDPRVRLYRLVQSWPTPSPSAETLIVRRDGDEVVYLNELRHRQNTALDFRLPLSQTRLPAVAALLEHEGIFTGIDYRGIEVLSYMRPVEGTPWKMVAKVDQGEVFGNIAQVAWISYLGVAIAVGTSGLILWSLWRRQSLEARLKLEQSLARIADLAPGVIHSYSIKPDGTAGFTYASAAIQDLFGLSPEALGANPDRVTARVHPDDLSRLEADMAKSIETGAVWHAEYRYKHPAKGDVWIEQSSMPDCQPDGTVIWHGFLRDITDRKRAEWRLHRLAEVVEQIAAVYDMPGLMSIVRTAARELTGADGVTLVLREGDQCHYAEEDAIGPLWKGRRFPLEKCISGWCMLHGKAVAIEDIYSDPRIPHDAYRATFVKSLAMVPIGRDHAVGGIGCYWASPHLATDEELGLLHALADAMAVGLANLALIERLETARQVAEKSLCEAKESEDRYRFLFENMLEGYALCRIRYEGEVARDFLYLDVNPAFEKLTGLADVSGKWVSQVIPGIRDTNPELFEIYGRVARTGQPERFEAFVDALGIWFSVSVYSPQPEHFVAVFDNITARKQAQQALEANQLRLAEEVALRTAELSNANRELQAFTYAASHDLKSPLRGISCFAELLERHYCDRLDGEGRGFVTYIRQCATRMADLIDNLLAYAKMEQRFGAFQPINLRSVVRDVLAERKEEIRRRGAEIKVNLPAAMVLANPDGLAQVLRNLIDNALKYASHATPPVIEIGGEVSDNRYRFWVRDNGIGFDMAYHDRIFEIFRRLHTYEEYHGSGVGLALVKKAMDRMGGQVWAESAPGQGATFFVELPGKLRQAA